MKRLLLLFSILILAAVGARAATFNTNCTATIQTTGACGAGDNGEAGVLFGFWVSLTDDAPGDPNVASNALDLRDALCVNFGIPVGAGCTSATADAALKVYLKTLVKNYRHNKNITGLTPQAEPVIDANP